MFWRKTHDNGDRDNDDDDGISYLLLDLPETK